MLCLFLVYHFPREHLKKIPTTHNMAVLSCTRDSPIQVTEIEVNESEADLSLNTCPAPDLFNIVILFPELRGIQSSKSIGRSVRFRQAFNTSCSLVHFLSFHRKFAINSGVELALEIITPCRQPVGAALICLNPKNEHLVAANCIIYCSCGHLVTCLCSFARTGIIAFSKPAITKKGGLLRKYLTTKYLSCI